MAPSQKQVGADNRVAMFVTCLIDAVSPKVGFAVANLIEAAGFEVVVPESQSCCGQPNYNGGDPDNTIKIAKQVIDTFSPFPYVVIASGSCGGMIKLHYVDLLSDDPDYAEKARQLSRRVYELSDFLIQVADYHPAPISAAKSIGPITYHDACAGLRELNIKSGPRNLLTEAGFEISEMSDPETCCGFGGTFCVKYPQISNKIVETKVEDAISTGAKTLVSGDLGCLLNMEGKIHRDGGELNVFHYAELLANSARSRE